ncbi:hypothetical protein BHE74_00053278 [Ensete ventricosum]|nr:hypothetical protein BHE74_00053278 [Ensete ventricosum]
MSCRHSPAVHRQSLALGKKKKKKRKRGAMGVRLAGVVRVKEMLQRSFRKHHSWAPDVPKGHFAVYVGDMEKRFVVPVSYLQHPLFQSLLHKAAEEYGFEHPGGVLRVPCNEDAFASLTSRMSSL